MNNDNNMELLFKYAFGHKFREFDTLFSEMEAVLTDDEFWEAYLIRAQIKLYTTDTTIESDLKKARHGKTAPRFPLLNSCWKGDGLNHFIVFPTGAGQLKVFLNLLPLVRKNFADWYAEQGDILVRQVQSEIHYFMGDVEIALLLAQEQYAALAKSNIDAMLSLIMQYRCNLALSNTEKAQRCVFDIIRRSKTCSECVDIYKAFRSWANITTSWSGDSPRFYKDKNGNRQPVLKDRLEGIKLGIARDTPLESPFIGYAMSTYKRAYILRQYYMDWFQAMYWHSVGAYKQMEAYFFKVYDLARSSGLYMPPIEFGEQIAPLFKCVKSRGIDVSENWIDMVTRRAASYEKCLRLYRMADMLEN